MVGCSAASKDRTIFSPIPSNPVISACRTPKDDLGIGLMNKLVKAAELKKKVLS